MGVSVLCCAARTYEKGLNDMGHITLKTRELSVVVGDNEAGSPDCPTHLAGYNGIWSLASIHAPQNCFVPSYAGLNLEHFMDDLFMTDEGGDIFEPRRIPMRLKRLSDTAVRLSHEPGPLTAVESEGVAIATPPLL